MQWVARDSHDLRVSSRATHKGVLLAACYSRIAFNLSSSSLTLPCADRGQTAALKIEDQKDCVSSPTSITVRPPHPAALESSRTVRCRAGLEPGDPHAHPITYLPDSGPAARPSPLDHSEAARRCAHRAKQIQPTSQTSFHTAASPVRRGSQELTASMWRCSGSSLQRRIAQAATATTCRD